jgi:hypothetical protein
MVALLKLPKPLMNDTERRMFTRKQIQARVQSKRLDHTLPALRQPQVSLDLRDLSMGGLSALSDTPLERGERVAIFFPPQGALRGWDAYGRVIRCETSACGYRIALEFDALPAA